MSAAEIADNKWELESTKPPVKSVSAVGQIALIGGLGLLFAYFILSSLIAIVSPPKEGGLEQQFKNMKEADQAGAAAPEGQ